jgi:hypothetical protein
MHEIISEPVVDSEEVKRRVETAFQEFTETQGA